MKGAREPVSGAPRAARASGAAAGERAPKWSRRRCCTGSGRPGRSYPRRADLRSRGQRGVEDAGSGRVHGMQAAAAARRARHHPHHRSAASGQRWPRVRAARRTKEHKLQVDRLHRSPRSGRTGSASAVWWLLRRWCRATRSVGWCVRRPTFGGCGWHGWVHASLTRRKCCTKQFLLFVTCS